jgi:lipopolysaccharide transport system permease protein
MTLRIESITIIEPKSGWQVLDLRELLEYKDLFIYLVWRNIKVVYAQTILGFSWAFLEPLIQILLFTVIFGQVAKIETDGIPYFLFSSVAIVPWSYMSQAMTQSSDSLVSGQNLLSKIYFPRLLFPLTPAIAKLMDFSISMVIILAVLLYYHVMPTWNLIFFPMLVVYMIGIVVGFGMLASALAIRFRDVRLAMPFFIRMFMYSAPIVYSSSSIPERYRFYYAINPLVGVIEGFRACMLGTVMPWSSIVLGMGTAAILLISGAFYFRRIERVFVDVI